MPTTLRPGIYRRYTEDALKCIFLSCLIAAGRLHGALAVCLSKPVRHSLLSP